MELMSFGFWELCYLQRFLLNGFAVPQSEEYTV